MSHHSSAATYVYHFAPFEPCSLCLQELFFSGQVNAASFMLPEEHGYDNEQVIDGSGRNLIYNLYREAPGFLLRNHLSNAEEPFPFAVGASSSSFCYVPYGQSGGYGGRCVNSRACQTLQHAMRHNIKGIAVYKNLSRSSGALASSQTSLAAQADFSWGQCGRLCLLSHVVCLQVRECSGLWVHPSVLSSH